MCAQKCCHCVCKSVLSFWFGNLNLAKGNKLGQLVSAGKVISVNQSPLPDLYDRHALRKALAIVDCDDHSSSRVSILR